MKRYRLSDLTDTSEGHFLEGLVAGSRIGGGGLSFPAGGRRSHTADGPGGRDYHTHDDYEVFVILQGKGVMELDGREHPMTTGDILVVEPGEDHHLIADRDDPCVTLWLHV